MLRGDQIICGTSTTGTGTLTLAATPVPPGGIDFDVFARATGVGFANSAAILVSYAIVEYTDSTFATAAKHEKGVGLLTLGGSSGITNATLARTTKQTSATSLNSQPATQNISPGTGISIATAANTLVFIGPSVADVMAYAPYYVSTGNDATGVAPMGQYFNSIASGGATQSSGVHSYMPFMWAVPMLVKSCTLILSSNNTMTGGTSNVYARLYAKGTNGLPSKLMYDFGSASGLTGASVTKKIGGGGSGYFLTPGEYYLDVIALFSGTTGNLSWGYIGSAGGPVTSGFMGTSSGTPAISGYAFTDSATTGPDPAFVTAWGVRTGGPQNGSWAFTLDAS